MSEVAFVSRVCRLGSKYYISVPKYVEPLVEGLYKKKVVVKIVIEEVV